MLSPRTLQAKLLVSVFLIVSILVISLTALVIYIEKERFQKKELDRIYYMTDGIKNGWAISCTEKTGGTS